MWIALTLLLTPAPLFAADPDDDDGDGIGELAGDCDDRDPSIYPGAPEVCDGTDQDCDTTLDNDTPCYDDDLDGLSEDHGDCNDADRDVFPGAVEVENGIDDDCDLFIDEGTEAYDDDGDGYSEQGGDCDDADVSFAPDQPDYCRDGLDSDCSGLADEEGCEEDPADGCDPDLKVLLTASRFSGSPGETITLDTVAVFTDALLSPQVDWYAEGSESGGSITVDADPASATWVLPEAEGAYRVIVTLTDDCIFYDLDELVITVRDEEALSPRRGAYVGGCGGGSAALLLFPALLTPLLGRRRRHRR